jgi:hypothetical protein
VHGFLVGITVFHTTDTSILGFSYLRGSWNQCPIDTGRRLCEGEGTLAPYLVGQGHEDSKAGQMCGVAYGVTVVYTHQEATICGPVAAPPCDLPVDTQGLLVSGLHLKVEGAHCHPFQEG